MQHHLLQINNDGGGECSSSSEKVLRPCDEVMAINSQKVAILMLYGCRSMRC